MKINTYYIESLKTYNKKRKPCNHYSKDIGGFCKHCNQLEKDHIGNSKRKENIDKEWVLVEKFN